MTWFFMQRNKTYKKNDSIFNKSTHNFTMIKKIIKKKKNNYTFEAGNAAFNFGFGLP